MSGFVFFDLASGCGDGGWEREPPELVGVTGVVRPGVNEGLNSDTESGMKERVGGYEPFEFSEEGAKSVVSSGTGGSLDFSSTIFGGGRGGGRSSYGLRPATFMSVG